MKITTHGKAGIAFDDFLSRYGAIREEGVTPCASEQTSPAPVNLGAIHSPGKDEDALEDFLQFVLKMEGLTERMQLSAAAME